MQATLAAGTTLKTTVDLPDYPAGDGWVLAYRLAPRGAAGAVIDITTTALVDAHQVNVPKATTAGWVAATYTVTAWVDDGTDRYPVASESGEITITPDPSTLAAGIDQRSAAEIALANIQATLAGKASSGTMEYTINGRQLRSYPLPDLLRLEAKFKAEVNSQHIQAGKAAPYTTGRPQRILARMP